jgi:hypothetical protein
LANHCDKCFIMSELRRFHLQTIPVPVTAHLIFVTGIVTGQNAKIPNFYAGCYAVTGPDPQRCHSTIAVKDQRRRGSTFQRRTATPQRGRAADRSC